MNELTKEELQWLLEDAQLGIEEYEQPDIAYRIRDKLQLMLNNYCEHISDGSRGFIVSTACCKCGSIYPENYKKSSL